MLNIAIFTGRLVRDPELRQTFKNGTTVANFTVAVQRDFVDKETGKREADFITCAAYGQLAEFICRNFAKGDAITITGRLKTSKYTDRNGISRETLQVDVSEAHFGERKPKHEPQEYTEPLDVEPPEYPKKEIVAAPEGDFAMIDDSDDLPF